MAETILTDEALELLNDFLASQKEQIENLRRDLESRNKDYEKLKQEHIELKNENISLKQKANMPRFNVEDLLGKFRENSTVIENVSRIA